MKLRNVTKWFLSSVLLCSEQQLPFAQQCPAEKPLITSLGLRTESKNQFTKLRSQMRVPIPGANYVRFHIAVWKPTTCGWTITVRDLNYRALQTINSDNLDSANGTWTVRIPGQGAIVDLQSCEGLAEFPDVGYDQIWYMPDIASNKYYSSQSDVPAFTPLFDGVGPAHKADGDLVGFLMVSGDANLPNNSWSCSGVVIAPDLFLTNWHCGGTSPMPESEYWNENIVHRTLISLSWDGGTAAREFQATSLVASDQDLDFSVLKIMPLDRMGKPRPATLSDAGVKDRDPLYIIHHPAGRSKQITLNCKVADSSISSWKRKKSGTDFSHNCDTESGSSGAPVFNAGGAVVGLHHLGFSYDANCVSDHVNKGVLMNKILESLRNSYPDVYKRLSIIH